MIKILDVPTAQETILRRTPLDQMPIPPSLQDGITRLFGEPLTPAEAVARILQDIRTGGDAALRHWCGILDLYEAPTYRVPQDVLAAALEETPAQTRIALEESIDRVEAFHRHQPLTSWITQDFGGSLGQFVRPIQRVGLYVPGGSAPLPSTVIMTAIAARVAGVPEIAIATPPQRGTGAINPITLAAATLCGIDEVYALGGAQAIAALAYGTESIKPVNKIFGPGNLFVTLAKQQVFGIVGIDGLAGPTETVVIADESARPDWAAADLLAQAEHDVLAAAILLTPSVTLAEAVRAEVTHALKTSQLSRREIISASLENRSGIVITEDLGQAVALANAFAPEHLALSVSDPWAWAQKVTAAGGVFLGEHSYEVLGDYIAGPSHVMPTSGTARFASPVNVWDFVHLISVIALDSVTAHAIAPHAARIAHAEGLDAHARAAEIRQS